MRKILENFQVMWNNEKYINIAEGLCICTYYKKGQMDCLEGWQGERKWNQMGKEFIAVHPAQYTS